jgi:hypothetical protein
MKCNEVPLVELTFGELGIKQQAEISEHLLTCTRCRERLRVTLLLGELYDTGKVESGVKLRPAYRGWYLAIAALVVIGLLGVGIYSHLTSHSLDFASTRHLDENAKIETEKYPYFPLETRAGPAEDQLSQAFDAYQRDDFQKAAELFGKLHPQDGRSQFYRGVSLYLLGDWTGASDSLGNASGSPGWKHPALWYRANSLLKLGETAQAEAILRNLADKEGAFQRESIDLLSSLPLRSSGEGQND